MEEWGSCLQRLDKRWQICNDCSAVIAPNLKDFYVCKVAVDNLFKIDLVLLKIEDFLQLFGWLIFR